jgi:hypothetical protein
MKMKTLLCIATMVMIHNSALADPQEVFRDASGRTIGTATRSGNQTTFRDAGGRTTGTATTDSQGTTVFRDDRGRTTGTTTAPFGRHAR